MPTHAIMMETSRHTKKTLYVVATFYVVVGFMAAIVSALNGDRLGTFLGFLMISGALVATAVLRAVLRIGVRISAVGDAVVELHGQMNRLEAGLIKLSERAALNGRSPAIRNGSRMPDSEALGGGHPGVLTAATLDEEAFPRLVAAMEEEPLELSDDDVASDEERSTSTWTIQAESYGASPGSDLVDSATKNLLRQWRVALRDENLERCREVYSALRLAVGADAVASMSRQIEELSDRVEQSLREAFSSRVRAVDYRGALVIGDRICGLFPDRAVTAEFLRIRPYLLDRLGREELAADPQVTVSQ